MKTRQPNIIDRTMNGQVPRPKKLLIDIISEAPPRSDASHIDMSVYRVFRSSGHTLRGKGY